MKPEIEIWLAKKAVLAHFSAHAMSAPDLSKYSDQELIEWAEKIWGERMQYEENHQLSKAVNASEQRLAMLDAIKIPTGYTARPDCKFCNGRGKIVIQRNNQVFANYCGCLHKSILMV